MKLKDALVAQALATDARKAEGMILAGQVLVNDVPVTKPGSIVAASDSIRIRGIKKFVSRAGEKLDAALVAFDFPVAGRHFLDIGSSTGGFTDALLSRGAASVAAIDVGKGLLHQKLRSDERVQVLEGQDFKKLEAGMLRHKPEAFVADLSFASLESVLVKAFSLLEAKTRKPEAIVLFKPQFEIPKAERGLLKKGILEDEAKSNQLLRDFENKLRISGIAVNRSERAAVKGTKGNQEFVLHLILQ